MFPLSGRDNFFLFDFLTLALTDQSDYAIYFVPHLPSLSCTNTHTHRHTLSHTPRCRHCVCRSQHEDRDQTSLSLRIRRERREQVDGCLLQIERPGPSLGEFVMCLLTLSSGFMCSSVTDPHPGLYL